VEQKKEENMLLLDERFTSQGVEDTTKAKDEK